MSSNSTALVSVIIPAYNADKYIREAISSVLSQSYKNFELIVINDGSTDQTQEVIDSFSDKRIILLKQENKGVSTARNVGIERSKGEWLAFLDADDIWSTHTLDTYSKQFDNADFIIGQYDYFNNKNDGQIAHDISDLSGDNDEIRKELMTRENFIGTGAVCVRASLDGIHFDEKLKFAEDYKLWLTLLSRDIKVRIVHRVVCHYRVHPDSALQTSIDQDLQMAKLLTEFYEIYPGAKKKASIKYSNYVNAKIEELIARRERGFHFESRAQYRLTKKTAARLFLYNIAPYVLRLISLTKSKLKQTQVRSTQ